MAQRKHYPQSLKTSVVLASPRGEASITELARQHGIHPNLIHKCRAQFLDAGERGLQSKSSKGETTALKSENERLKRLLAKKELKLDIAKKSRGL
ncbi:MAG: transposase [Trueperaceae bacterium]|nr:MAG: transposase [Trueperaceae bacterium]